MIAEILVKLLFMTNQQKGGRGKFNGSRLQSSWVPAGHSVSWLFFTPFSLVSLSADVEPTRYFHLLAFVCMWRPLVLTKTAWRLCQSLPASNWSSNLRWFPAPFDSQLTPIKLIEEILHSFPSHFFLSGKSGLKPNDCFSNSVLEKVDFWVQLHPYIYILPLIAAFWRFFCFVSACKICSNQWRTALFCRPMKLWTWWMAGRLVRSRPTSVPFYVSILASRVWFARFGAHFPWQPMLENVTGTEIVWKDGKNLCFSEVVVSCSYSLEKAWGCLHEHCSFFGMFVMKFSSRDRSKRNNEASRGRQRLWRNNRGNFFWYIYMVINEYAWRVL